MDYCTPDDVAAVIPRQTLIELTQDGVSMAIGQALPEVVNETVVSEAIRYAVELIDAHLRGRYTLPLTQVPTVLKDLALNLVCHALYRRRPEGDLPDAVKESYRATEKTLVALRDGKLTLGIQATQKDMPEPGECRVRSRERQFGGRDGLLERY
ncbi:gp436 family protein [Arsenophonus sp.]|uniref:gp436 family protein n=1 Tax=Arsenophonus sp. TaxID=1872640 RepID=UPI0038790421